MSLRLFLGQTTTPSSISFLYTKRCSCLSTIVWYIYYHYSIFFMSPPTCCIILVSDIELRRVTKKSSTMATLDASKKCPKCGGKKSIKDFHGNKTKGDEWSSWYKGCQRVQIGGSFKKTTMCGTMLVYFISSLTCISFGLALVSAGSRLSCPSICTAIE